MEALRSGVSLMCHAVNVTLQQPQYLFSSGHLGPRTSENLPAKNHAPHPHPILLDVPFSSAESQVRCWSTGRMEIASHEAVSINGLSPKLDASWPFLDRGIKTLLLFQRFRASVANWRMADPH